VFLGSLAGRTSPVHTYTPLLGAELTLPPHAVLTLDLDPTFEHGVLVDIGPVIVDDTELPRAAIGIVETLPLRITNPTETTARVILLGGAPFEEDIVMWWNFVGRDHDEIAQFRDEWQRETDRFGRVKGYPGDRIPAPPLPNGRLRPRGNPR
jgi:hypothetical protein